MADLLPLIGFVFFGLFSPGPNVILITTSGARFGFAATGPHIVGVALGVGVVAGAVGLGLGAIVTTWPVLTVGLKLVAGAWIGWMAWGLWQAKPASKQAADRPFTFLEAVMFQWVNPKIWAVSISALAYVADRDLYGQAVILALTFTSTNIFVCLFWAWAGSWLSFLTSTPNAWRMFMRAMAVGLMFFSLAVFL